MSAFRVSRIIFCLMFILLLGLSSPVNGQDKKKKKDPSSAGDRPALEEADSSKTGGDVAVKPTPTEYWPRFRGPDGQGFSADGSVPTEWSDTKNLKWKFALPGPGSSSPIVWKDRVFVTSYSGYGDGSGGTLGDLKRHLICVNIAEGKPLWSRAVPAAVQEDAYKGYITQHGYASNTPVTDGERVYVFFSKTGVLAFDMGGKQLWQTSVGTKSANRRWGSAASLVLYKDLVIVNAAEESRSIQALDAKTGAVVWKAEASSLELCYGTPILVSCKDGRQDLVIALANEIWGINPDTGKLRWFAKTRLDGNVSPSVVVKDDLIIAFGGYPTTSSVAIRTGGKGDITASHTAWTSKFASYVSSPVIRGDHLLWVNDRCIAYCLDVATGNKLGDMRLSARDSGGESRPIYASSVLLADKLLAVTRRSGTFVLEATPKLTQIACNEFKDDDSDFNAAPAVSAGRLFLRSNRFLYCVEKMAN
jgi:outer membrane protein assembly factor BamB